MRMEMYRKIPLIQWDAILLVLEKGKQQEWDKTFLGMAWQKEATLLV